MGTRRIVFLAPALFFFIASSGCSAIHQQIIAAARQPGYQLLKGPGPVWRELDCGKRDQPFVQVETMEVLPETIKPGGRVNYRLIYAMCSQKYTDVRRARVIRNIIFNGEQVAKNIKDDFELKPGRWAVDSFFTLPAEAPLGVYALEVALETAKGDKHKQVRSFVVSNEFYLSGR